MLCISYTLSCGFGFNPVTLFIILYAVLILYYIARYIYQKYLIDKIKKRLPNDEITRVFCLPTIRFNEWRVVVVAEDAYYVGRTFKGQIVFTTALIRLDRLKENYSKQ
ncbi:hypothetical protein [Jeotgalicoccus sp. WY2]|uniref:hypothetical protein n=1 Tax=Jeotgalicoccus sp. WY2 TaxID=2708346 RepID=UPI002020DE9C|nr:hypothetical protein [Jeotgalicoccus sp. WY2]